MFKKLKDKIAEEVKQSPLKFQTSVQQLTQAVSSSPSLNSSVNSEIIPEEEDYDGKNELSNDCVSKNDLTLSNTEYDTSFTTIDLRSPASSQNRRSSSISTINSELFPVYEFPTNRNSFQSDLESNSEFDDGSSIHQFNNVSKENLYQKYRIILQKYHKYRGRFSDAQKYCKELEREYNKATNVLTETQDKAIRRITELREQCSLEQKAKAHLEDALRNELEERDHIIDTLNTKIILLKMGKDSKQINEHVKFKSNVPLTDHEENINQTYESHSPEIDNLKDKIKNYEALLNKAKDAITSKNIQIQEFQTKIESNKEELSVSYERIAHLQNSIDVMKRKEEEALLSLAENKLIIHKELEAKESQIKDMDNKIAEYENEIKQLKTKSENSINEISSGLATNAEIEVNVREDEIKALQRELDQLKTSLQEKNRYIDEYKSTIDYSNQELMKLKNEIKNSNLLTKPLYSKNLDLPSELTEYQNTIERLELSLSDKQREFGIVCAEKDSKLHQLNITKKSQTDTITKLEEELSCLKLKLSETNEANESLRNQIKTLNDALESTNSALNDKNERLKLISDNNNQLETELLSANDKLKKNSKDKKSWEETETHLKADKIILEETMKNVKNELIVAQEELKKASVKIEKYEKELKTYVEINEEKRTLENVLAENEKQLLQISTELENKKKTEQKMLIQTANFLEEINSLKLREDDYLSEIRNLKTNLIELQNVHKEVENLNAKLKENLVEYQKSCEQNEILKSKNDSLNGEVEIMKENMKKFEKLRENHEFLQKKYDILKNDEQKSIKELEELEKSCKQNEYLKKENEALKIDIKTLTEKISEMKKLQKRESFQEEKEALNQDQRELHQEIERLKKSLEAISSLRGENDTLLKECEKLKSSLKAEQQKWQDVKHVKNDHKQSEQNITQNEQKQVEFQLLQQDDEYRILLQKYNDVQNCVLANEKLNQIAENKIESLAIELNDLKDTNQKLRNENESYAKTCDDMKLFVNEIKPVLEQYYQCKDKIRNMKNVNEKLSNELMDLRTENVILTEENKILGTNISNLKSVVKNCTSIDENISRDYRNILKKSKNQILDFRKDYFKFKSDLSGYLNVIKQYFDDWRMDINDKARTIIEKQVQLYSELENRFGSLENQYESLNCENILLKEEKQNLLSKIDHFSNISEVSEQIQNKENEKEVQHLKQKYAEEIKEIITGYEIRLAEKDNEYEELQNKMFTRSDKKDIFIQHETKEIIRDLQEDLTNKQDVYEELLDKYNHDTQELNKNILELKERNEKEIKDLDKKWRSCLDKKTAEAEERHQEELNELTKEWTTDRKQSNFLLRSDSNPNTKFLEDSVKHCEDNEALKKQVQVLSNELHNYKKSHWRDIDLNMFNVSYNTQHSDVSLDDCTEMEYLRNILFEYMMGHQPVVLAKVLAAVVKFDNKQTKQVLQREEQKQSLLGQLGL